MTSTSETGKPHLIFLSHSGQEKPFVRRLYKALCAVGHDPFFDTRSIPPGEIFPPHIFDNVRNCKLGVVVLSPGFLTSKWPMTELHAIHTSPSHPKILPLFLSVQPDDLKPSSSRFSEWRKEWHLMAEQDPGRVSVAAWQAAATELPKIHGVVHRSNMEEEDFIEEVVRSVSSIIRPLLRFDVSHLTGHERLTQVVAESLERVPRTPHLHARALGLHGIGGLGKTTMCKLMINHYAMKYMGKCALIQFPSTGCTEKTAVAQCKGALEQLIRDDQSNTHRIDDIDEVVERFRKQAVARHDVFIAIDNIWDDSLKYAQRILNVGFSSGSMILVTSRSKTILLNLLKNESCVQPLPGLSGDEARQLFATSFDRNQGVRTFELERDDVQEVTKSFLFADGYHPLAISAAGATLGRSGEQEWLTTWKKRRTGCCNDTENAIKINFDTIPESRQDMFLDVVGIYVCVMQHEARVRHFTHYRTICHAINVCDPPQHGFPVQLLTWLNALYGEEMDTDEIRNTLKQLAYDGLLEFEGGEVHVHDLYRDLAAREAVSRGFVDYKGLCQRGMIDAEVKRIAAVKYDLSYDCVPEFPPELHKLQVVAVSMLNCSREWKVVHMPELRVLHLNTLNFVFGNMGWRWWWKQLDWEDRPKLSWLSLRIEEVYADLYKFGIRSCSALSCLRNLWFLHLEALIEDGIESSGFFTWKQRQLLCLEGLVNLQFLSLAGVGKLGEISGLGSLINLEHIIVLTVPNLVKVGDFESCDSTQFKLQRMQISGCPELREVAGLARLTALQELTLGLLSAPPADLSAMTALSELCLSFTAGANVAGRMINYRLPNLKKFRIGGCNKLEEIGVVVPSLTHLHIESSATDKFFSFTWLQNRFANLRCLDISNCRALEEIEWSSLNDLPGLEHLQIKQCPVLECIRGEPAGVNNTFHSLSIWKCPRLTTISGLHLLTDCKVSGFGEVAGATKRTVKGARRRGLSPPPRRPKAH